MDGGFKLRQWVRVVNRFTVNSEYGDGLEARKDINIGVELLIIGCTHDKKGTVHLICMIKNDINENLTASGEFQVKTANVEPSKKEHVDPARCKDIQESSKAKPPKGLEWMQDEPVGTEFHHHKKWVAELPNKDA